MTAELIYYNLPVSEMESVKKYLDKMDKKITEVIELSKANTSDKNELKLLEDALQRIEKRKAQQKAVLRQ